MIGFWFKKFNLAETFTTVEEQPEKQEAVGEKKIWIDPELTFMPMKKIKSGHSHNAPHEAHRDSMDDVADPATGNMLS